MPIYDDAIDDESFSNDNDDVSLSSVRIVPLFLPQPVPPLLADDVSIHSEVLRMTTPPPLPPLTFLRQSMMLWLMSSLKIFLTLLLVTSLSPRCSPGSY